MLPQDVLTIAIYALLTVAVLVVCYKFVILVDNEKNKMNTYPTHKDLPMTEATMTVDQKERKALINKMMALQEQRYLNTKSSTTRGQSAFVLATMALEHGSSSAEAAAELLMSLEFGESFELHKLLRFDPVNRAHADIVITSAKAHDLWPSRWMETENHDGREIMSRISNRWHSE